MIRCQTTSIKSRFIISFVTIVFLENTQSAALQTTKLEKRSISNFVIIWALYAKSNRQFYRDCRISGTVDFIFGDATAVFQHCDVVARLPLRGQQNTITAQSRATAASTTGFSFQDCNVYADDDLLRGGGGVETYLGRPWQPIPDSPPFSRVVFMECAMSDVVDPKGWLPWEGRTDVSNVYYGEYKNTGDGADVSGRVTWTSFHVIQDASEAAKYTVENFIQGDKWIPGTGVYFEPSHSSMNTPSLTIVN